MEDSGNENLNATFKAREGSVTRETASCGRVRRAETVSRHYSDNEWAKIVAGVWAAERPGQVRMFMTTKRTMWSSELGREYGWVLCPIRRPSRALVVWLLANLEEHS